MYVCVCRAVKSRALEAAIDQGATSITALQKRLAVGTGCGQCLSFTEEILREKLTANDTGTRNVVPLRSKFYDAGPPGRHAATS